MNATEAKELTLIALKNSRTTELGKIISLIRKRAIEGAFDAVYNIDNSKMNDGLREQVITDLRAAGYKVEHKNGYDQRDGDSWNYLIIEW